MISVACNEGVGVTGLKAPPFRGPKVSFSAVLQELALSLAASMPAADHAHL
ncbi:MAG TPA: hypothetical protein VMT20_23555 [Terriglobia bacterium]|nr:hypothetical protein [Terriglobia bacterium]